MTRFYVPNPGFSKEIMGEDDYMEGLKGHAEKAKTLAESFSPVRTGAYQRSFVVVEDGGNVYLANTDWKAHWIEWGSAHNTAKAPIRRGILAAGLRFKDEGKPSG
jgi:hypothetical protein